MHVLVEGELVEFKREFSRAVLKTVVAFANTKGGVIYLGIDDDGTVRGLDDPDSVLVAATNAIRDSIKPNPAVVAQCERVEMDGKALVGIRVERGSDRPYYLAAKGMRPEGVYVRQGAASYMATEAEIIALLRESQGDSFETGRSLRQDLTFTGTSAFFDERGLDFGLPQMRSLGLIDGDGQFTNLGWLLSDQFNQPLKLAAFFGTRRTTFKERCEAEGSLLVQLAQALDFLGRHMHYKTRFENMVRVDYEDFPPDAVREALVNAIVHRDYANPASTLVSVMEDRFEVVSHGGLPSPYSLEEFQMNVSVLRNPRLAGVFYRLGLIEAYGTGVRRMFEAYEDDGMAPEFEITRNVFKVTMPNRNRAPEPAASSCCMSPGRERGAGEGDSLRNQERVVLTVLEEDGPLRRSQIQERLDFSQATLLRILKRLEEKGLVKAEGNTRRRVYCATGR